MGGPYSGPLQAARHAIGTASTICFFRALLEYRVPMYLSDQAEGKYRAVLQLALKNAPVDLTRLDLYRIEQSQTAQKFLDIHLGELQAARVDDGLPPEKQYYDRVAQYLDTHLTTIFFQLLEDRSNKYDSIRRELDRESFRLASEVAKLTAYQDDLASRYHDSVPNHQEIRLSDLYIEPRCKILEMLTTEEQQGRFQDRAAKFVDCDEVGIPTDLHHLANDWLTGQLDTSKIMGHRHQTLLLYGMPGQGKTSFCKRLLHDRLAPNRSRPATYFVRFRDISNSGKLKSAPMSMLLEFIQRKDGLNITEKDLDDSLLVLDGLDELAISEDMTMADADRLLGNLLTEVRNYPDLRVVVTSRHGYLDASRNLEGLLVLSLSELEHDQQKDWLIRYRKLVPTGALSLEKLGEIQKHNGNLAQLLTQPLLLQLVADLADLPETSANRALVYEMIFDQMVSPSWKKEGQISALFGIEKNRIGFRNSLGEIAFKMFTSHRDYITIKNSEDEAERLPESHRFRKSLNSGEWGTTLKLLYIAFYFREVGLSQQDLRQAGDEDQPYGLEFAHKSFMEYLVAEYLYRKLNHYFLRKDRDFDNEYEIAKGQAAMEKWHELFGTRRLTDEIEEYLLYRVQNDPDQDRRSELKKRLQHFLPHAFDCSFLWAGDSRVHPESLLHRMQGSFANYIRLLGHLDEDPLVITEGQQVDLARLIKIQYVSRLKLIGADLNETNLRGADLSGADLRGAYLSRADLSGAYLSKAYLRGAYLRGADLKDVKGLTIEQLLTVESLWEVKHLSPDLLAAIQEQKPELLEKPEW